MTKSSVDRKRSRYGEKYSLRFHKQLKIYNLSCNDEIPSLIAKFVETDGDLAMKLFERLESNYKENEQLKKDATTLIYANQDYRQQNQNLQKQLDYIQNSITNAIKHQKTELGVKALQEIIADYNEWMLGHK